MLLKPEGVVRRGPVVTDLNVFLFLTVLIFLFALMGLLQKDIEWAIFPGFGVIMGLFFHISLLTDGSLTEVSGGTTTAIVSASTALSNAWLAIQWVPAMLTIISFFIAAFRVGKSFG